MAFQTSRIKLAISRFLSYIAAMRPTWPSPHPHHTTSPHYFQPNFAKNTPRHYIFICPTYSPSTALSHHPQRAPHTPPKGLPPRTLRWQRGPSLRPRLTAIWRASSGGQPPATQLRVAGFPTPQAWGALTPSHSRLPHPKRGARSHLLTAGPHTPQRPAHWHAFCARHALKKLPPIRAAASTA